MNPFIPEPSHAHKLDCIWKLSRDQGNWRSPIAFCCLGFPAEECNARNGMSLPPHNGLPLPWLSGRDRTRYVSRHSKVSCVLSVSQHSPTINFYGTLLWFRRVRCPSVRSFQYCLCTRTRTVPANTGCSFPTSIQPDVLDAQMQELRLSSMNSAP